MRQGVLERTVYVAAREKQKVSTKTAAPCVWGGQSIGENEYLISALSFSNCESIDRSSRASSLGQSIAPVRSC